MWKFVINKNDNDQLVNDTNKSTYLEKIKSNKLFWYKFVVYYLLVVYSITTLTWVWLSIYWLRWYLYSENHVTESFSFSAFLLGLYIFFCWLLFPVVLLNKSIDKFIKNLKNKKIFLIVMDLLLLLLCSIIVFVPISLLALIYNVSLWNLYMLFFWILFWIVFFVVSGDKNNKKNNIDYLNNSVVVLLFLSSIIIFVAIFIIIFFLVIILVRSPFLEEYIRNINFWIPILIISIILYIIQVICLYKYIRYEKEKIKEKLKS